MIRRGLDLIELHLQIPSMGRPLSGRDIPSEGMRGVLPDTLMSKIPCRSSPVPRSPAFCTKTARQILSKMQIFFGELSGIYRKKRQKDETKSCFILWRKCIKCFICITHVKQRNSPPVIQKGRAESSCRSTGSAPLKRRIGGRVVGTIFCSLHSIARGVLCLTLRILRSSEVMYVMTVYSPDNVAPRRRRFWGRAEGRGRSGGFRAESDFPMMSVYISRPSWTCTSNFFARYGNLRDARLEIRHSGRPL